MGAEVEVEVEVGRDWEGDADIAEQSDGFGLLGWDSCT